MKVFLLFCGIYVAGTATVVRHQVEKYVGTPSDGDGHPWATQRNFTLLYVYFYMSQLLGLTMIFATMLI